MPVLNMIDLTVAAVTTENLKVRRPGLLASTAVLMTGLYKKRFEQKGLDLMVPADPVQAKVMTAIRQIKTGRFGGREIAVVNGAARELTAAGAEVLIVACTELSIISASLKSGVRLYDNLPGAGRGRGERGPQKRVRRESRDKALARRYACRRPGVVSG